MIRFLSILCWSIVSIVCLALPSFGMPELGEQAPEFTAKTYQGEEIKLADYKDKVVVLEWFNPGCPFVVKHYQEGAMQELQKKYGEQGVAWFTVNSTNPTHKDFLSTEEADKIKAKWSIVVEMIEDADGKLGQLYQAKTTPHLYVIDKGILVYKGAADDAPDTDSDPRKSKNYVRSALDSVLSDKPVKPAETKPYGCSVKYGN